MQLRHLLSIKDLEASEIFQLCERARHFQSDGFVRFEYVQASANLFIENSTRTRVSFERACQLLGKSVVNISPEKSSLEKGESLLDTLRNLKELSCDLAIIRITDENLLQETAKDSPISIINAGDGTREHPTQALLDLYTIWQNLCGGEWDKLRGLKIGIMGDLLRSRVAQSWHELGKLLGLNLFFYSPAPWKPTQWQGKFQWSAKFKDELPSLDVINALRVQRERIHNSVDAISEINNFISHFQIRASDLDGGPIFLMAPGPVNWGVELSDSLGSYKNSLVMKQVNSGLYLRAAVIEKYSTEKGNV